MSAEAFGLTPGEGWDDAVQGAAQRAHEELARAQAELARIRAVHAAATDARAVAVWRARQTGASLGALGHLLGMARKNVLALERRGAEVVAERPSAGEAVPGLHVVHPPAPPLRRDTPTAARGHLVPEAPRYVVWSAEGATPCLREKCPFPAADGHRFCTAHLYN